MERGARGVAVGHQLRGDLVGLRRILLIITNSLIKRISSITDASPNDWDIEAEPRCLLNFAPYHGF